MYFFLSFNCLSSLRKPDSQCSVCCLINLIFESQRLFFFPRFCTPVTTEITNRQYHLFFCIFLRPHHVYSVFPLTESAVFTVNDIGNLSGRICQGYFFPSFDCLFDSLPNQIAWEVFFCVECIWNIFIKLFVSTISQNVQLHRFIRDMSLTTGGGGLITWLKQLGSLLLQSCYGNI